MSMNPEDAANCYFVQTIIDEMEAIGAPHAWWWRTTRKLINPPLDVVSRLCWRLERCYSWLERKARL